MIDKSFIEKISELSEVRIHEIHGRQYAERALHLIPAEKRPVQLFVNTLTGLVDYLNHNVETLEKKDLMIHVQTHDTVDLISRFDGDEAKRTVYVSAMLDEKLKPFPFGQWMDQETFIIALQSQFEAARDQRDILELVAKMTAERSVSQEDDGITQKVQARQGIALVANIKVPNPVTLVPYRTFREVEQPISQFVFRVRNGREGQPPQCALFEADGGAWRLTAIETIRDWLQQQDLDVAIIA